MRHRALSLLAVITLLSAWGCTSRVDDTDAGQDAGEDDGSIDAGISDAGPPDAPGSDSGELSRCDEVGETCCSADRCGPGLVCLDGLCGAEGCGAIDAPCCELDQCDPGGVCTDGTCQPAPCGTESAACCDADPVCGTDLECIAGTCSSCGSEAEPCCTGDVCDDGLSCLSDLFGRMTCVAPIPCGSPGAECCTEGDPCGEDLGCTRFDFGPEPSFQCMPGPACGGDGRVCCAGAVACGPGMDCAPIAGDVDRCRRCGENGLACCVGGDPPCGPGLACTDDVCSVPAP